MRSLRTMQHLNAAILGMAGGVLMLCAGSLAFAAGVPNTFSSSQTVSSSQMNANFSAVEADIANPNVTGNITMMPATATTGVIMKGTVPFMHDYGPTGATSGNTFLGANAGNFTMGGTAPSGTGNTGIGSNALQFNTTGSDNTASGYQALLNNTTGGLNTASGLQALYRNTAGNYNTASGYWALLNNTTGGSNIALGYFAGSNLTTGNNNIDIGNSGATGESSTIRIGISGTQTSTYIAGISGVTSSGGVAVYVNAGGQLGTATSSRRYKDGIADMGAASDVLMRLRPVTFYYKADNKLKSRPLNYGLVAEEVEQVAPQLVANNAKGEPETVYYQFLAPMLLNEYQKQQHTIQAQAAQLNQQKAELNKQKAHVAALEQQAKEIVALRQEVARMSALLVRLDRSQVLASASR